MALNRKSVLQFFSELLILALIVAAYFIIRHTVPIFHRGFFCDDESLMHPYKENTVPYWMVAVFGVLLNFVAIVVIIPILYMQRNRSTRVSCHTILKMVADMWPYVVVVIYGVFVTSILTEITKKVIGRLRPHFFDVCRPSYNGTCTSTRGYIEDFPCNSKTSTDYMLTDMRKSFPSGHTSSAMYCAVIFMLFLQSTLQFRSTLVLRGFLQASVFALALYVGVSRISDYKHHWSDVLAGGVLGIAVAVVATLARIPPKAIEKKSVLHRERNDDADEFLELSREEGGSSSVPLLNG